MKSRRSLATLRLSTALFLIAIFAGAGLLALRYHEWRTASTSPEIADTPDEPLGKFSIGRLHFGAAFTTYIRGSFGGYCEPSSSPITNPPRSLVLSSKDCYALNLTTTVGPNSFSLLIPMPK